MRNWLCFAHSAGKDSSSLHFPLLRKEIRSFPQSSQSTQRGEMITFFFWEQNPFNSRVRRRSHFILFFLCALCELCGKRYFFPSLSSIKKRNKKFPAELAECAEGGDDYFLFLDQNPINSRVRRRSHFILFFLCALCGKKSTSFSSILLHFRNQMILAKGAIWRYPDSPF